MADSFTGGGRETSVYRIDKSNYLFVAATVALTIGGSATLVQKWRDGTDDLAFALVWFGILGWFWFNILNTPYELRIEPDGRVVFRSLRRRMEIQAGSISRVGSQPFPGGVKITHDRGTVWLRVQPVDFFDFLTKLRELNPRVEIRGV